MIRLLVLLIILTSFQATINARESRVRSSSMVSLHQSKSSGLHGPIFVFGKEEIQASQMMAEKLGLREASNKYSHHTAPIATRDPRERKETLSKQTQHPYKASTLSFTQMTHHHRDTHTRRTHHTQQYFTAAADNRYQKNKPL